MDDLTRRLREDAARIDVAMTPQLDERIRASLEDVTPERPRNARTPRSFSLWWASSLTGVAAAIAVIAVVNLDRNVPVTVPVTGGDASPFEIPALDLDVEAAVLTSPLTEELEALQSDLEKAEKAVREDFPLGL